MLINIVVTILAILIFLFIFWKRLKEDYSAEIIFKSATYILVGIGVALTIASNFFPLWFFWASLLGGLTGFSSLSSFLAFAFMLIMLFASYYFDTHYKRFSWYKSGRIGFAGVSVAIVLFLVRSAIAIFKVPVLSFVGRSELIISGVVTVVSFILLFNLGRIRK
jgi:hypothetical protein